ncbi:MAG: hypothetical protein NTZ49_03390 [Candidatus Parcubacteria bacterium]|nr:hypothetical protein [Candidatus Parcubacteria bacterium]
MKKKHQHNIIILVCILLSAFLFHQANAGLVSNFSDQLSRLAISTSSNHTLNFTISSDFSAGKTLELYFESGFDLSDIDYTDIDFKDDGENKNLGETPGNGVGSNIGISVSGQTIIFIQNDTDSISASSVITILIGLNANHQLLGTMQMINPDLGGIYKISLAGNFGDMGTISVQILSTDGVGLNASIEPAMSFSIRNSEDSENFSGCSFNNPSISSVSECSFRLAAETNVSSGFQVWLRSDGDLRNINGTIAKVIEDQEITAGNEAFGLALQSGTGINEAGDFTDDETPVSSTDSLLIYTNSVYNYIQGELSTTSIITLKLAISHTTKAGHYSQAFIFTLLPNY